MDYESMFPGDIAVARAAGDLGQEVAQLFRAYCYERGRSELGAGNPRLTDFWEIVGDRAVDESPAKGGPGSLINVIGRLNVVEVDCLSGLAYSLARISSQAGQGELARYWDAVERALLDHAEELLEIRRLHGSLLNRLWYNREKAWQDMKSHNAAFTNVEGLRAAFGRAVSTYGEFVARLIVARFGEFEG